MMCRVSKDMKMDARNCGFCQPCAEGRYDDECETIIGECVNDELITALTRVQECLKKHKQYSNLGNGYLEEADEIISTAISKHTGNL